MSAAECTAKAVATVFDAVAVECPSSFRALRAAKAWDKRGPGIAAIAVWVWLFRWAELRGEKT